jgi:hypothetical protein
MKHLISRLSTSARPQADLSPIGLSSLGPSSTGLTSIAWIGNASKTLGKVPMWLGACSLVALASCGGDEPATEDPATVQIAQGPQATEAELDDVAQQDLIATLFAEEKYEEALALLKPRVARDAPKLWDLNAAGICSQSLGDDELAQEYFLRALDMDASSPVAPYNLGQLAFFENDLETANEYFAKAHELAPADLPTELALAQVLEFLEDYEGCERHLRSLEKVGIDYSGSWYRTIIHRLSLLLFLLDREEEGLEYQLVTLDLIDRDIPAPTETEARRGNFGRILPPTPLINDVHEATPMSFFGAPEAWDFPGNLLGITPLALTEYWTKADTDNRIPATMGTTDWLAWGDGGVFTRSANGEVNTITTKALKLVRGLDIEQLITKSSHIEGDGDGDFIGALGKQLLLFQQADGKWTERMVHELPSPPSDMCLVDYDHEGDLDLLVVGDFGLRMLRNDGAFDAKGGFTDVTVEAGLEIESALDWCIVEDLDTDKDVDFLVGGAAGVFQADNLRGGLFQWMPERSDVLPRGSDRPLVADRNGDARPDLFFGDGTGFAGRGDGSWKASLVAPKMRPLALLGDVDMNGDTDGLGLDDKGMPMVWSGMAQARELGIAAFDDVLDWGSLTDADGDGAADLVVIRDGVANLHAGKAPAGSNSFRLALRGIKDNRRGVGSIVEVRSGKSYRRIYWRGEPVTIGLGDMSEASVVRITWPNGVVQNTLAHPAGAPLVLHQKEGLIGSCPFLYSWNGTTFTFISDVLGITPLGLPMAPGMLVPPDHDEYVLVTGEQMVPRKIDGGNFYDLQFTEELREVTYLDEVRLQVIDHPIGSEIFPDERFTFPPFPEAHTHLTTAPQGPLRARQVAYTEDAPQGSYLIGEEQTERDWAEELSAIDGEYAAPFTHYRGRFQGLTPLHATELTFDGDIVRAGGELRLFMTGWFYWTNASVNMATARTPGVEFMPPVLQVPDGDGGWRDLGPPVGFPAGKTKTMVIDIAGALDPDDPRLRVVSTLRLYWDSIRLGLDENAQDDAPMIVTELALHSSNLWERGFSRPIPMAGQNDLQWFEWDELEPEPRWNQHPGQYTRHGQVDELLHAPDDMFVILGSGDSLLLRFDADQAPPLREGYRRDYLLFLDGWAKDRDPNSVEAKFVEPLPFHGMSGYPYGEAEHFPNGPVHQAWRKEWNTRQSKRWIERLAPNH